jgi:hypothetical protein
VDDFQNTNQVQPENSDYPTSEPQQEEIKPEPVDVSQPSEPERQIEPEKPAEQPVQTPNPIVESASTSNSSVDAELEEMLSKQTAKIKVVGTGGGGNNTINRITEVGIHGTETIAVNTDAQDLLYTSADKKILIGRETTSGMGAGSNPRLGEEAAKENEHDIKKAWKRSNNSRYCQENGCFDCWCCYNSICNGRTGKV